MKRFLIKLAVRLKWALHTLRIRRLYCAGCWVCDGFQVATTTEYCDYDLCCFNPKINYTKKLGGLFVCKEGCEHYDYECLAKWFDFGQRKIPSSNFMEWY